MPGASRGTTRRAAPPGSSKSSPWIIAASSRTRRRIVPSPAGISFARIGGRATIDTLVDGLYDSIKVDAALRPFEPFRALTDAELVNAAALAMLEGRGELAEFLMREVRQRRERAMSNVVPFQSKRPGPV